MATLLSPDRLAEKRARYEIAATDPAGAVYTAERGRNMGSMSESFIPEADALDQRREVAPELVASDDEREPPIEYPERIPFEASESDVLEQEQTVGFNDEDDLR